MSDATKSLRDTIISASEDAQSAWCVRPAPDHPARAAWEVPFRKQLDLIATLCRSVTTSTVLPPFVIAYLREYNAAWNDHKRVVNIEALEPAQDGLKDLPPFIIDEGYQLRPKKGWWSQYGAFSLAVWLHQVLMMGWMYSRGGSLTQDQWGIVCSAL